jgi:REP element-mobilizing transposase RayT
MKVVRGLGSLRSRQVFLEIWEAIHSHPEKLGMRVCQFSVQSNHLHLVVEATGKEALSRGMQGLAIRIAKAINRALGRLGAVFADRYFSRILRTPLEVKRALAYVLDNARKHGARLLGIDPCSSGAWFDGWRGGIDALASRGAASPVAPARTWLLRTGWRRHGLIEIARS